MEHLEGFGSLVFVGELVLGVCSYLVVEVGGVLEGRVGSWVHEDHEMVEPYFMIYKHNGKWQCVSEFV